jgi:hypothetical protein
LADVAVVVASAEGSGGTWTGALEALKGRWVPVLVRADAAASAGAATPAGNAALIARGGAPLASGDLAEVMATADLIALVPASASAPGASEPEAPYKQGQLFEP